MSSPARSYLTDGDDASDLARVRGHGDDDRGSPSRSNEAQTSLEGHACSGVDPLNISASAAQQHEQQHQNENRAIQACDIETRGNGDDTRDEPSRSKRVRTSLEGNADHMAHPQNVTIGTAQQHERQHQQERRAIQACFRCRKQKLRCLGGRPCIRCIKASKECDFGKGNVGNVARFSNIAISTAQQQDQQHQQERRAIQACFRCRRQKLRCLGGRPCVRCAKANTGCDFGKPGQAPAAPNASTDTNERVIEDGDGVAARARLEYLEHSVANLLAGLHTSGASGPDLQPASATTQALVSATAPSIAPLAAPAVPPVTARAALPAPGPSPYDTTAFANSATPALLSRSAPATTQGLGQVRFVNSPEVNFISPLSYSSRPETTSPSGDYDAGRSGKHKDNDQEAEERLASATRDGFEPPFQALVYQVSLSATFVSMSRVVYNR